MKNITIYTFAIILSLISIKHSSRQLKVDSNGNTTVKYRNFSSGNDGILYLGNTDHYIKGVFGYGVQIGTAGMSNWIRLKQYTGGLGINRDPSYTLDVNGAIRANLTLYTSDVRSKTNIKDLEDPVTKIKQIKGVSYNLLVNDSLAQKYNRQSPVNKNFGFIAQDFQKVYPELVYEDEEGYLSIDYISVIPLLLKAIKEMEARIETMENNCFANNETTKSASITGTETDSNVSAAILYQNSPNPFSSQTTIKFEIPPGNRKCPVTYLRHDRNIT